METAKHLAEDRAGEHRSPGSCRAASTSKMAGAAIAAEHQQPANPQVSASTPTYRSASILSL